MIIYSIQTGKIPFKNVFVHEQRSEFIEKVKNKSLTIEQPEFKMYEKLINDCIIINKSSKYIFSKILKQQQQQKKKRYW